ncbi:hypothetical protein [Tardiphaga sp.]|uniref:hypothetical protein n=1 Tax=Tardiphaga sp. TaxID=1926292 RepID=UPI0037D9ADDA
MADETGNNEVRDTLIVNTAELRVTIAPDVRSTAAALKQTPSCLRDNECSQQQLVRLVGYRGPSVDTAASWDRLRRQQAALRAS